MVEQTQYTSAVVYTTSVLTADSMYTVIHVIAGTALKQGRQQVPSVELARCTGLCDYSQCNCAELCNAEFSAMKSSCMAAATYLRACAALVCNSFSDVLMVTLGCMHALYSLATSQLRACDVRYDMRLNGMTIAWCVTATAADYDSKARTLQAVSYLLYHRVATVLARAS
eukprot:9554-Heterococcus_DN1.PRE.11